MLCTPALEALDIIKVRDMSDGPRGLAPKGFPRELELNSLYISDFALLYCSKESLEPDKSRTNRVIWESGIRIGSSLEQPEINREPITTESPIDSLNVSLLFNI